MSKSNSRFIVPAKSSDAGKAEHKNISIIIPVAGMGSRMKRYGPKCLFPTSKGSTILSKIIKNIRKVYPYCEIIATVGFDADKVIDSVPKNIRIVENQLYDTTNMVESIRLALNNAVNDDVIIVNGDLIFNVFALQNLTKHGSCVVVDSQNRFNKKDEVGVTVIDNMAVNFAYGLPIKWAQIIYLTGKELVKFHEFCNDREKNKMHTFEILNMVIESGGVFLADEPKGMQIKEIDSLKDLPRWDK